MSARVGAAALAVAVILSAGTAEAHRLKLFVDVTGGTIAGYGFFVGGGRPQGAAVHVRDDAGRDLATLTTDRDGRFSWAPPRPGDYVVTLDAGDGHFVDQRILPDRFAPPIAASATPPAAPPAAPPIETSSAAPMARSAPPSALDPRGLADLVEASVDRALARRLEPLFEAQVAAEGRLRLEDIVGGIGMIVGLVGMAAWGSARRRERGGER